MLPQYFIFIAAGMRIFGSMAYVRATLSGRAKPNALSWLLWAITPFIAFAAEISAGVGLVSIVTLALGIGPLLVFITAMFKNSKLLKLDGFNIACALLAVSGIILWRATSDPQAAIVFAIAADIVSAMPTIRKIVHSPRTEYSPTYALSAFSMILALLTIQSWTFAAYAFPVYILSINSFIVALILMRQKVPRKFSRQRKRRRAKARRL